MEIGSTRLERQSDGTTRLRSMGHQAGTLSLSRRRRREVHFTAVVRFLAHMVAAHWMTGAVEGRILFTHLRQSTERALGTLRNSTGGSAHDGNRACVLSMLGASTRVWYGWNP